MTVRGALAEVTGRLRRAGVEDAEHEAGWLLAHVLGCSAGSLRLKGADQLGPEALLAFERLSARREGREPIQYILGTAEFLGLTLRVTPAVLIPRLDTETLVTEAASRLSGHVVVADIGTGSGAIAVGLASLLPMAQVIATDISAEALAVARQNAQAAGFGVRIDFRQGDLLAPLSDGPYDAILSNPPYIAAAEWADLMPEVRRYEPRLALSPGADGLWYYRRLAAEGPKLLSPGGFLAVEVGAQQGEAVSALFAQSGLTVSLCRDTANVARVVIGRKGP